MSVKEITFNRVLTRDGETMMARDRNLRLFLLLITVLLTPGLIRAQEGSLEQAKKEGRVVWYTAMALEIAEQLANIFEKTYGIKVELTRSASERVVARVLQEAQAGINNVDIIEISEAGDFALLKQKGLLRAHRPKNYERFPSTFLLDKDGYFHAWRAMIFTSEALRHLVNEHGASQIMIGTDYAVPWVKGPVDHILNTPGLSDAELHRDPRRQRRQADENSDVSGVLMQRDQSLTHREACHEVRTVVVADHCTRLDGLRSDDVARWGRIGSGSAGHGAGWV